MSEKARVKWGRLLRAWIVLVAGVAFPLSYQRPAQAFCQTTTCDPNVSCRIDATQCCMFDDDFCDTNGLPLRWPNSCVSYNVQEDGSPLRDISAGQLGAILDTAYDRWLSADCGDEQLSLAIEARGTAVCATPEFNQGGGDRNANIWMFDDRNGQDNPGDTMGIDATALGVAVVSFNYKTAEIYDVDVVLNAGLAEFTTDDDDVEIDLQAVATHEAGHFLGLDHSLEPGATMAFFYDVGDTEPRTLSDDDEAGICASYPEDREIKDSTCDPRGKYHEKCEGQGCDCRLAPGSPGRGSVPTGAWFAGGLLGLWIALRRRRTGCQRAN